MPVFTHGAAGIARSKRGPWYLFTGNTDRNGDTIVRRIPPGRTRAIRALQHTAPTLTYLQPTPIARTHALRKAAA